MLSFKSWFQIESLSPLPLVPTRTFRNTFPPWKRKHIYCEGFWPSTRPWLKIQQKQIWRKTWTSLKSGNPPQTGSLRSNSPPTPPSISWSHHGTRPFDCTTSTRTPWGFSTSKRTFMFDAVLYTCVASELWDACFFRLAQSVGRSGCNFLDVLGRSLLHCPCSKA